MFRPTVGELLRGIRTGLEASVLPVVTAEASLRQLKAALHLLQRLERCWDRLPAYLAEDNHDIRLTLDQVFEQAWTGPAHRIEQWGKLKQSLSSLRVAGIEPSAKIGDPNTARLAVVNLGLQQLLAEVDAFLRDENNSMDESRYAPLAALGALYPRMIERELKAWGTADKTDE